MRAGHAYCLFSARYRPLTGGVEAFTERLAHELATSGERVVVVTSLLDGSPEHEVQGDGVEVWRLPTRPLMGGRFPVLRDNARCRLLLARIAQEGFDRVLVNTRFYGLSLAGVRFAADVGALCIVLDHGSAFLTLGNAFADVAVRIYERHATKRVKALDPAFAGISYASATWLSTFGIETRLVVPNAIDVDEFRSCASDRDFRAELRLGKGQVLVACVGRLAPEKGPDRLAQAAGILGERYVLAFAGEGVLRREIEAMDEPNVRLLGNLGRADLSALLRDADIFCLPTRSEGFCTSLLEAAAWGVPPVITHVGGTDEVMGNPVRFGVMLADPEPSIIACALRSVKADKVSSRALEAHVREDCSWQATMAALNRAFASACSRARGR